MPGNGTDAYVIRPARPDDGAACAVIYAPFVTETWVSMEAIAPSPEEMSGRIERTLHSFPWLVAEAAQGVSGYAYASAYRERSGYRWSTEVTVYLAPSARGRGVARALYSELIAILARQGYRTAWAGIALPNPASIRLHESMGFEPLGTFRQAGWKLGDWRDVGYWGLKLGDGCAPRDPTPYAALEKGT